MEGRVENPATAADPAPGRGGAGRIASVDAPRGAVMVVMALDHVRTYLGPRVDPEDLSVATPTLCLTR